MDIPSPDLSNKVLITGAAGFIGFHLAKRLVESGHVVIGFDNLNDYYDVDLKSSRLEILKQFKDFHFVPGDISNNDELENIFQEHSPKIVINLAAQAGVRYSLQNPQAYIQSNIVGFANILEACRNYHVEHLLYASSSSVYGGNSKVPFSETDPVEHPVSLYAATKRSNELMADCYSHLYSLKATGLRFFTVYGPYGRPDMAYFGFANLHFSGKSVKIYNNGDIQNDLSRDFTYIDDVVESVVRLISHLPDSEPPHQIYNVGGSTPEKLTDFVTTLEKSLSTALGAPVEFSKIYENQKPGDVPKTYADATKLYKATQYKPETPLQIGLQRFADWYIEYYKKAENGLEG